MKDRNAAPRPSTSGNDAAERMLARHRARLVEQRQTQLETAEKVKEKKIARDLIRQMPRRWQAGDVYAPHDLSSVEMRKWKKKSGRAGDLVDALNLSPLDLYKVSLRSFHARRRTNVLTYTRPRTSLSCATSPPRLAKSCIPGRPSFVPSINARSQR